MARWTALQPISVIMGRVIAKRDCTMIDLPAIIPTISSTYCKFAFKSTLVEVDSKKKVFQVENKYFYSRIQKLIYVLH